MKIHQNKTTANLISAYDENSVKVLDTTYKASIIVTAEEVISNWPPQSIASIDSNSLKVVAQYASPGSVVILGVGQKTIIPKPEWQRVFVEKQVALEVMAFNTACYTYNILVSDLRPVVVALILPSS